MRRLHRTPSHPVELSGCQFEACAISRRTDANSPALPRNINAWPRRTRRVRFSSATPFATSTFPTAVPFSSGAVESRLSIGALGRAARRGCVRLRVDGPPGVEHDRELGMEATLRNRHRFLIIGHVGVEPGLKVDRSKFRSSRASRSARLGSVRASEARVINTSDSQVTSPARPRPPPK
jgi:hypothetical protein